MRSILAFAIVLLSLSSAAPEPDYSSYIKDYLHAAGADWRSSLIEIESSTGRTDRLAVASLQPHATAVEIIRRANSLASRETGANGADGMEENTTLGHGDDLSLNDLCNALYTSAEDNDLPIPFFANLIWQESRLRVDDISRKGALGIAQFMPETAAETGLDNPFDPMQAIPASARLLRELRLEFGNLGFVAAAYNAGAHRVAEWLQHRNNLPRETRGYVISVTGLSVDDWRKMAVNDDALAFARPLPCRALPAFASVEQAQSEQVQLQQAKLEQVKLEQAKADEAKLEKEAADAPAKPHRGHHRAAERKDGRGRHERHEAQRATRGRHAGKHEVARHAPESGEKRTRA